MGLDAPILPPGGASRPKLHLRHTLPQIEPPAEPKAGQHIQAERLRAHRRKQIMVRKTLEFAAIAGLLLLSACNTVEGAGKDVSSAGKAVANAADEAK